MQAASPVPRDKWTSARAETIAAVANASFGQTEKYRRGVRRFGQLVAVT